MKVAGLQGFTPALLREKMEEVVVVGGGPAGLSASLALLERGVSPLVLERSLEPGQKACGELLADRLYGFEVGELVRGAVEKSYEGMRVRFHGRELLLGRRRGLPGWNRDFRYLFLDRKRWEGLLCRRVERKGGEIRRGEEVRRVERGEGCLVLNGEIRAKLVIGADGALSLLRGFAGGKVSRFAFAVGRRVRGVEGVEEPTLVVDPSLVPSGYAWIFPGRREANVGAGVWWGRPEWAWGSWRRFSRLLGVEEGGARGAFIPLSLSTRTVSRRLLLAGDAGGFADPLTGGGLNAALLTGWLAGETCAEALKRGEGRLEEYERGWRSSLYLPHLRSHLLSRLLYTLLLRWRRLTPFLASPLLTPVRR